MKKLILALLAVFAVTTAASARDTYSRNPADLPAAARAELKKSFKAEISLIKIDKDLLSTDYEVVLTDGTEVKFDSKGNWQEVECRADKSVPDAYVPAATRQWLAKNHKGVKVVGIEKTSRGYEAQLSNGLEAKFDAAGRFLRYDD